MESTVSKYENTFDFIDEIVSACNMVGLAVQMFGDYQTARNMFNISLKARSSNVFARRKLAELDRIQ